MAWPALVACAFGLLAPVHGTVVVYTQDIPHTIVDEFNDQPAAFGAKLPDDGLRGLLVRADPPDGCIALAPPPSTDNFTAKWIILIARYNCTFEVKIRNAQAAGFDCAIVHNVNSSELDTMTTKHPAGIDIPSVFVSDAAGHALAESYLYNYGYYIMVNGAPFDINTQLLLPFAIVVAICLFIMIGLMIAKCIRDRQHARRRRLPARSLRKIPTCKFSKGDPYDTCAICLDDYVEGDRLRVLPCAHAYHAACIDPWLTQSRRVCPVCKRRVFAAGERRAALSDSDSDDSREPLVSAGAEPTQGGTFAPQRENPFVRAARLVTRARASRHATPQYWVDFKAKLKKKAAAVRADAGRTGGGPSSAPELSNVELMFLRILGPNYGLGLPGVRVEPFPDAVIDVKMDPAIFCSLRTNIDDRIRLIMKTGQMVIDVTMDPAIFCSLRTNIDDRTGLIMKTGQMIMPQSEESNKANQDSSHLRCCRCVL